MQMITQSPKEGAVGCKFGFLFLAVAVAVAVAVAAAVAAVDTGKDRRKDLP